MDFPHQHRASSAPGSGPAASRKRRGVSLVEVIVGTGVFVMVAASLLAAIRGTYEAVRLSRTMTVASALATEQFEIARNMPYADVGVVGGLPAGKIPYVQQLTRAGTRFTVTTTVRNFDDPFDGRIGGSPNDTSPADYKLVEVEIACATCKGFAPTAFTTHVAPAGLEGSSTNGALFVQVIDGNGQPVAGADVTVQNASTTPSILVQDVTNNDGMLQLVDVPPSANGYRVTVTKAGYSTERTYGASAGLPHPVKPHGTVAAQQVTQMTFLIDRVSTVNFASVTGACAPAGGIDLSLRGAKLIGTAPDARKYEAVHATDGGGLLSLPALEWDSYVLDLVDAAFDLAGTVPLLSLNLAPNTVQNFQLIVAPKQPRSLLVTVKDAVTQLPLTDADVRLQFGGFDGTLRTNQGFLRQTDWSGGAGQVEFLDAAKYFLGDGFLETSLPAGELRLKSPGGSHVPAGQLESSTFDTGSASHFHQLVWLPSDQPPGAGADPLRFQVATSATAVPETWNFVGPDGTPATFYSATNTNIGGSHDGDRYLRYKVLMTSSATDTTPLVSDVSVTFTSSCTPPGQVLFTGLGTGAGTLTVTRDGYQAYADAVTVSSDWRQVEVSLLPN